MTEAEFFETYQFLNNFVKYVTEKQIINLASAIAIVVRSMLETILSNEKSLAINQLRIIKRLIVFINSTTYKKTKSNPVTKQLFSAFGNIFPSFIRVYLKRPGISLLSQMVFHYQKFIVVAEKSLHLKASGINLGN